MKAHSLITGPRTPAHGRARIQTPVGSSPPHGHSCKDRSWVGALAKRLCRCITALSLLDRPLCVNVLSFSILPPLFLSKRTLHYNFPEGKARVGSCPPQDYLEEEVVTEGPVTILDCEVNSEDKSHWQRGLWPTLCSEVLCSCPAHAGLPVSRLPFNKRGSHCFGFPVCAVHLLS